MSGMKASLSSRRFMSPPRLNNKPTISPPPIDRGLASARVKDDSKFRWAKLGIGLGVAAATLSACGTPTPPATDPGVYAMEDPELVVLSDSIDRIDLARETETDCTGPIDDETCTTSNVAYHPIAIHFGHGIAQDLNGNLFESVQLIAPGTPGAAVVNPDKVVADGPLGFLGTLTQTGEGRYTTKGSIFGYNDITISGGEAVVEGHGLFGGRYETMRVSINDGRAQISEGRWDTEVVQSMGDHILVQNMNGGVHGKINYDLSAGTLNVSQPALFGDYKISVSYGPNQINADSSAWGGDYSITRSVNGSGNQEFQVRNGGWRGARVEKTENGWIEDHWDLFSTQTEYTVTGGEQVP